MRQELDHAPQRMRLVRQRSVRAAVLFFLSHSRALSFVLLLMTIAIVGGTGTVGRRGRARARARGHAVRVLSRHAPRVPRGPDDGGGLAARSSASTSSSMPPTATARCCSRAPRGCCARSSTRASSTTSASRSSASTASAAATTSSSSRRRRRSAPGVPWTIVRATQFHTLVAQAFATSAKLGILPSAAIAAAAGRPARGRPRARRHGRGGAVPRDHAVRGAGGRQRARACAALASGRPARTPSRCALPATRALRAGGLTNPGAWRGTRDLRRVACVGMTQARRATSRRCARGCCGSPTGSSAAWPSPRTSSRMRGCGCSASTRT